MDSFEFDIDPERGLVQVRATGELLQEDGEQIITKARTRAAELGFNVLYDVRDATPKVPLANWFHLPRELGVFQESATRYVHAAVLITPGDHTEEYLFYELVTKNLGLSVRIFFDETAALEWLEGQCHRSSP